MQLLIVTGKTNFGSVSQSSTLSHLPQSYLNPQFNFFALYCVMIVYLLRIYCV